MKNPPNPVVISALQASLTVQPPEQTSGEHVLPFERHPLVLQSGNPDPGVSLHAPPQTLMTLPLPPAILSV